MENSERQEIMAYRGRETVSLKDILVHFLSLNADKPQPIWQKNTRFKGYSLFLYIPSPSPTPLTVIDEIFWRGIKKWNSCRL